MFKSSLRVYKDFFNPANIRTHLSQNMLESVCNCPLIKCHEGEKHVVLLKVLIWNRQKLDERWTFLSVILQENFFDIQEALQAIHMRQEMLREQLACAKSKGEETVGRNLQVGRRPREKLMPFDSVTLPQNPKFTDVFQEVRLYCETD